MHPLVVLTARAGARDSQETVLQSTKKLIHRSRSDYLRETKTVVYQCTYIFEAANKQLSKRGGDVLVYT